MCVCVQELDSAAIDGNAFEPEVHSEGGGAAATLVQAMAAAMREMGIGGGGGGLEDLLTEMDD